MARKIMERLTLALVLLTCVYYTRVFAQEEHEGTAELLLQQEEGLRRQEGVEEKRQEGIGKWLQEAGFFTGYIQGSLKNQDDLEAVATGMRFGFDLKPFVEKFGIHLKGMLEILYEPFINTIIGPRDNVELGCAFLFRYSYPLTRKFYPYVEVGSGLYYMTLSAEEQSTQFNFIDQGGGGFSYFLRDDLALNVGYRFRHVSNCSIKQPNNGINANVYLAGMSYYF